jgi:hypothetical protein
MAAANLDAFPLSPGTGRWNFRFSRISRQYKYINYCGDICHLIKWWSKTARRMLERQSAIRIKKKKERKRKPICPMPLYPR